MLVNGIDVTSSTIAGGLLGFQGGNASGTNSVVLFKNRTAAANTIPADGLLTI